MLSLETERLLLKEITWNDLEEIHRLHSIPEVDEFNTLGIPRDIEETRELVRPEIEGRSKPQKKYCWKVLTRDSAEFAGLCGFALSLDKYKLGEIWYKLDPSEELWSYSIAIH